MQNRYITVAYDLYSDNEAGIHELLEQAPAEHPFQFISNLGMTLEAFEQHIADLNAGDEFDFTLTIDEAYGPYEEERVITVPKNMFEIDGRFAAEEIYPGNVIPLVNEEGLRFYGLVTNVSDDGVVLDLNDIYAGRELHYRGHVITAREATNAEIIEAVNALSGGGSGCGGCGGGGCNGCSGCKDGEGKCNGEGCNHDAHDEGAGHGSCGGHGCGNCKH